MMAHSEQAPAAGGPVNVVLLGHSYIRRLGEYTPGIPDGANLGLSDIKVTYVCQGGMTLRSRGGNRWIRDHLTEVTSSRPSVIVLHIGENDLGSLPASEVVGKILQLTWDLRRDNRCPVYVTQLLAWPCHSPQTLLDVEEINTELLHTWPTPYFWRHLKSGLNSRSPDMFEGVHLSLSGMEKYYQSIRTCIGRAIHHFRQ